MAAANTRSLRYYIYFASPGRTGCQS